MDSDKPSDPSKKAGDADDLIEEMARLMASDAQDSKPAAPAPRSPAPDTSRPADAEPRPSSFLDRPNPGGSSGSPTFGSQQQNVPRPAPEPVAVPRETPAPSSGSGGAPGWLPEPKRQPERQEPSFAESQAETRPAEETPKSEPFDFGLRPAAPRDEVPQTPAPEPRAPQPQAPEAEEKSGFDFDFGLERPRREPTAPAEQQSELPAWQPRPSAPSTPAPNPEPAAEAPTGPDPIADLIKDQMAGPEPRPADTAAHSTSGSPEEPTVAPDPRPRDDFNVPPVFGLSGDSERRSTSGSDALDDIENLIGSAVRVDMDDPAEPEPEPQPRPQPPQSRAAPVPQPPVRPHQSQPAERSAGAEKVDAAEAAILAALASSGGHAETTQPANAQAAAPQQPVHAETRFADDFDDEAPVMAEGRAQKDSFRWGRIVAPIAALLLLSAIGYAGYMFLTATPPEGEAPVLLADSDPAKQTPEADTSEGTDQSVVFSDDSASDGSDEQLVSRDQSQDTGGDDAIRQIITADTSENGLANRKVRTVTVRPDGTIVSGDDLVAGSEALPVDRPDVPELPADAVTSDLANTDVTGPSLDDLPTGTSEEISAPNPENLVSVNGSSVPFPADRPDNLAALRAATPVVSLPTSTQPRVTTPTVTTTPQQQQPVVQQPNAVDLLGSLEPEATPVVNTTPEVTQTAAPSVNPTSAAAWVQLASQRDQAVANSEAGRLSRLYSSALGGRQTVVQRADLDNGAWYRVLVPAGSLSEAQTVCSQIKSIGGDCFARPN